MRLLNIEINDLKKEDFLKNGKEVRELINKTRKRWRGNGKKVSGRKWEEGIRQGSLACHIVRCVIALSTYFSKFLPYCSESVQDMHLTWRSNIWVNHWSAQHVTYDFQCCIVILLTNNTWLIYQWIILSRQGQQNFKHTSL